jgi:hypothetical protein
MTYNKTDINTAICSVIALSATVQAVTVSVIFLLFQYVMKGVKSVSALRMVAH